MSSVLLLLIFLLLLLLLLLLLVSAHLECLFAVNLQSIHVFQDKFVEGFKWLGKQRTHRLVHHFIKLGVRAGKRHPPVTDDFWDCYSPRWVDRQHAFYQLLAF